MFFEELLLYYTGFEEIEPALDIVASKYCAMLQKNGNSATVSITVTPEIRAEMKNSVYGWGVAILTQEK